MGKQAGLAIVLLLLLMGLPLAACSDSGSAAGNSGAGGAPSIVVDNEVLDFGNVHFNQWVRPSFQVRNEGDSNLVIRKATVEIVEGC